jgi:hypothetical protein
MVLQIPKAGCDVLDKVFMPDRPTSWIQIVIMILYLAAMIMIAQTTLCAIYLLVEDVNEGRSPSLPRALRRLTGSFRTLLPAVLLLAVLVMIGFAALVVPALYFTAVYLYVPPLAVLYPDRSVASLFYLSSRVARKYLGLTLTFVFIDLSISCALYFEEDILKSVTRLLGFAVPPAFIWGVAAQVGLSLVFGSLLDVALAQCFYQIKLKENLNA